MLLIRCLQTFNTARTTGVDVPYIKPEARVPLDEVLDQLPPMSNADDCEYVLARAVDLFLGATPPGFKPEFDDVIEQLPDMPTTGTLGYVVAVILDQFLLHRADMDTQGQLRFMYQGEAYGVVMRVLLETWTTGGSKARDTVGLLTSILFDYFHCVQEPYENDVRARSGEVWKSAHRLPGHAGNPV